MNINLQKYSKIGKRNLDITVNQIITLSFTIKPNIGQKLV